MVAAFREMLPQLHSSAVAVSVRSRRLIKQAFRYAFMLASIKREEFVTDGRTQEIENAIELAREAQTELLSGV